MITVYTEMTRIAGVPPYLFFAGLATVAALIPFVAVLLKKDENLRWFGWQFGLAGLGLLLGGRFFGFLVEVANCLQEGRALTFADVRRSAFVAYGGVAWFYSCISACNRMDGQTPADFCPYPGTDGYAGRGYSTVSRNCAVWMSVCRVLLWERGTVFWLCIISGLTEVNGGAFRYSCWKPCVYSYCAFACCCCAEKNGFPGNWSCSI